MLNTYSRNFQCGSGSDDSYIIVSYTFVYCTARSGGNNFLIHELTIGYSDHTEETFNFAEDCGLTLQAAPDDITSTDCFGNLPTTVVSASTITAETSTDLQSECNAADGYPINMVEIEHSFSTRIASEEPFKIHFQTRMNQNQNWCVILTIFLVPVTKLGD